MASTETLTDIAEALQMDTLTSEPSQFTLNAYADRIEAVGSESPYANIAVGMLRRGEIHGATGMVMVAARG